MRSGKYAHWGLAMLLIGGSVLLGSRIGAQENKSQAAYQQLMATLEKLAPGKAIEVNLGTEKEKYEIGERVEARFRTNTASYFVLMHISAPEADPTGKIRKSGDITFLLPNAQFPDNTIQGERVYSTMLDFKLQLESDFPIGLDTLNLFCSADKMDLFDADFEKAPFYRIRSDDEEQLKKLSARLELLKKQKWSGASVSFLVQEKGAQLRALPRKYGALPPIKGARTTRKFWPEMRATGTTGKQ